MAQVSPPWAGFGTDGTAGHLVWPSLTQDLTRAGGLGASSLGAGSCRERVQDRIFCFQVAVQLLAAGFSVQEDEEVYMGLVGLIL